MPQNYQQLLTELAQHLGLDAPGLLAQQEIGIEGLQICLQPEGGEEMQDLLLCTFLGELPQQRFEEVTRMLLQANNLWAGTCGATLGLSPAGDMVSWCTRLSLRNLDAITLASLLADFAALGRAWGQYLQADAGEPLAPHAFAMAMRV